MSGLLYEGWLILAALLPSIGLLYLFYVVMKHMVEGDRRERAALREADRLEASRQADGGVEGTSPHHGAVGERPTEPPR